MTQQKPPSKKLKDQIKEASVKEKELEAKKARQVGRKSVRGRAANVIDSTVGIVTSATSVALLNPMGVKSVVNNARNIGKQFVGLKAEIHEKSRMVSKERIDALGNFMMENTKPEALQELKSAIVDSWGKNPNIAKFVEKLEKGQDISLSKVERLLDKKPKARDEISEKVQAIIDDMSPEKRHEMASVLYDSKSRAALQAAIVKEALQNQAEKGPAQQAPPPQTRTQQQKKEQKNEAHRSI